VARAPRRLYLPYYRVTVEGARPRQFYVEAHISMMLDLVDSFALATPRDLGFELYPAGAPRLEPAPAVDVEERLNRALEYIVRVASEPGPSFDVGGIKGILKAIAAGFGLARRPPEARPTERLGARLAYYYVTRGLGLEGGERLRVSGSPLWLGVVVEPPRVESLRGERLGVLEKLLERDDRVRRVLYGE